MNDRENRSFGIAVKGVVLCARRALLLHKSDAGVADDPDPTRRYDLPGGRLLFGESPEAALGREALEECSIHISVRQPINTWTYCSDAFQLVGITYLCYCSNENVRLSGEHASYQWVEVHALDALGLEMTGNLGWLIRELQA